MTPEHTPNIGGAAHRPMMRFDVLGRIQSTSVPLHHPLLPVIEAVVNSIHATDDRFGDRVSENGAVEVRLQRLKQKHFPSAGRPPIEPILSVTITDNGIGFTDENLAAFETANTRYKASRGGKGVGRFSWLVVFREAHVQSTFQVGAVKRKRTFSFRQTDAGIEEFVEAETSETAQVGTTVRLISVQPRYDASLRKGTDVIAERIVEQCFDYFVLGRCPRIRLIDDTPDGEEVVILNDRVAELGIDAPQPLVVGKHELTVRHVQQPHAAGRTHKAHLCANHREVLSFPLSQVSELGSNPVSVDGKLVVHHAFVSGKALDEAVDSTRTQLDLPDGMPLLEQGGMLDLKSLRDALGSHVDQRLSDVLRHERQSNLEQVELQIRTQMPEYRHLIHNMPDQLARVRYTTDTQRFDEDLYRVQQAWEIEVRRRQAAIEKDLDANTSISELEERLYRVIQEVNEAGQANLVRYVSKRRAVLKLLQHLLGQNVLEAHIHRIVFPLRKTADEVAYDEHNLWLIDDALSFYEFVASDKPMKGHKSKTKASSTRRPDVLAFKTGDVPYQHIALVEFKRPERADENPVQQLVEYAVLLRKGGARDAQGRSLPGIPTSVRIDAYAVVTLSPDLESRLRTGPGNMQRAEGDWRWYGGVPAENLSLEVLDFQAFVRRAEQRNRAFFTKLNLT